MFAVVVLYVVTVQAGNIARAVAKVGDKIDAHVSLTYCPVAHGN